MPQSTRRLGRSGVPWGRHECGLRPERVHILDAPRARVDPRSRGPTRRVRVRPRTRRGRVAGPTGGVFGSLPLFRRVFVGLGGLFGHFSIITLYTTFIGVLARCVCGCGGEAQGCAGVVRRDTPSRAAAVGCCPSAAVGASRPFARDAPRGCDAASHDVGRGGWGPVPTARTSLGAAPVVRCAPERRVLRTASAPVPPPRPAPAQRHGATAPSPGRPTPGVVKQDKSSGGSADTTKTRSGPQRLRMSSGERPIGAAKGKQTNTIASCQAPPPPLHYTTIALSTTPALPPPPHHPFYF